MIDVARARVETPGCGHRIHLDNAGASLMTEGVLSAQIDHLRLEASIGGYEAARATADAFERTYDSIARMLGASRGEVALVENATVAWQLAFGSIPLGDGDSIVTSQAEYASNYIAYLRAREERGVRIVVVEGDDTGAIDLDALASAIDGSTKLISLTHVPTNGGLVNPAEEVGAIARAAGVPFLLDACQSVGQLDLDVERLGCDFLSATGRKFLRGPRGTGFLYVRRSMLDLLSPPAVDLRGATWVDDDRYALRDDARRYENWEFNHAAVLGLGRAVDEALGWGLPAIEQRVGSLAETLRGLLGEAGLDVRDLGARRCGIVSVALDGTSATDLRDRLGAEGVNVSVSGPASTRLDATRRDLPDLLRFSPHYFNTEEELSEAVRATASLVG